MDSSMRIGPKLSGYLEKKGKKRMVSTWKKYWFVLESRLLLYYRSKDEYKAISPCKGTINLGPPCIVKACPNVGNGFQIETRTNTVTLKAENCSEQKKWMQTIMAALNQNGDINLKKLQHFRYSLDDLKLQTDNYQLKRQNSMPNHFIRHAPNLNQSMIDSEKIRFGGSLGAVHVDTGLVDYNENVVDRGGDDDDHNQSNECNYDDTKNGLTKKLRHFVMGDRKTTSNLKKSRSFLHRVWRKKSNKPVGTQKIPVLPPKKNTPKTIDEILEDLEIDQQTIELRSQPIKLDHTHRHSDELNRLLDELTKVTTAPIMTPGVTTSLINPHLTDDDWLKMQPIRQRRLSEPDYDVPRSHKSIIPTKKNTANRIEATRFFGPILPTGPETDDDLGLSITPDSLELERLPEHTLSYTSHNYLIGDEKSKLLGLIRPNLDEDFLSEYYQDSLETYTTF